MSLISKIQSLISSANAVTGESRTDLTSAVQDLKDGYGGSTVEKGLVFSEYDSDGYPTKAEFTGFTIIPQGYVQSSGTIFKNIKKINIPNGVTTIQAVALQLNYLEEITLPNTLTSILNNALRNTAIVDLTIPLGVTALYVDSLANMEYCETITFEGDITAISRYAFEYTGRRKSTLTLDFSHCSGVPTLENANAFLGTPAKVIKVPQALLSTWQNATNWVGLTNVTWQGV